MELGTGERPNYPKPEPDDENGTPLVELNGDYNRYPRTTEPRKTWLDECAMMAMAAIIASGSYGLVLGKGDKPDDNEKVSVISYQIADAMLAEKMKREAKE